MRTVLTLHFMLLGSSLFAQGPFQFREACRLERRISRSGQEFSVSNAQELLSRLAPSFAKQFEPQRTDPAVYAGARWVGLLEQTDQFRRMGGLELAEKQYLDLLSMLRKVQGPSTDDVAMMLDHIGEFYLEARTFDRAYQYFSEALGIRRTLVDTLTRAQAAAPVDPAKINLPLLGGRLHLADLLTRLGQLDLGRANLAQATAELAEATAIGNESTPYRRFASSLDPVYFQSLVLEKQGKWQDAETLWRDAVKGRETIMLSEPYWNALKEQAASYARHGDFHQAADIARRVQAGITGKRLNPELPMPYKDNRDRTENQPQYSLYSAESNVAMSEILAIDKWRTDGPDAAAALLQDPLQAFHSWIDHGSDSERAQMLAWFERRIFLHMSILLDGQPSQDRVDKAYSLLSEIKGRYLASNSELSRRYEPDRGNPNVQLPYLQILDRLSDARARQAHLFVATALDGKPFDNLQFAASENLERVLTEALSAGIRNHTIFNLQDLSRSVTADSAFIDTAVWERIDRSAQAPPQREYGAFVVRGGQPVRYVRIGPAEAVDADIAVLEAGVMAGRLRGVRVMPAQNAAGPADVQQRLKSLYQKVIAPLEPLLGGASKLLIVPDGKLALAPVGALIDGGGHYLLERRTIAYLNSWRDLFLYPVGKTTPPVIVANPDFNTAFAGAPGGAGNPQRLQFTPLPGAELEAGDVAKALAIPPDRLLVGKQAREELIRSITGPEILHFATHSIPYLQWKFPQPAYTLFEFPQPLAAEDPFLQSVIALAGANRPQAGPEDGLLTGLEVASLRLSGTRLVVLSTCESGQGVPVDGQGVLGLRAAFSIAGADAAVMSLWPVDDQAGRQFMQLFYSHLAAGPAEALRQAQLDMRTRPQYQSPFYWAGYVASANLRPVPAGRPSPAAPPTAAAGASGGSLAVPACFQMSTRSDQVSYHSFWDTIRIKSGGLVRKTQPSPERAVYELLGAGSDVEYRFSLIAPDGQPVPDSITRRVSDYNCGTEGSNPCRLITLTVERQKDHSAVYIQAGNPARMSITLKGAPGLFPSFDFPEKLPSVSSYTEATVLAGSDPDIIDKIGSCAEFGQ